MRLSAIEYFVLFSASMLSVGLLTPIMRQIAIQLDVVDRPNQNHKTHRLPIPYLGGIAIMMGVLTVTYLAVLGYDKQRNNISLASSLLMPAFLLGLVGLIDDLRNLSPWLRFIAQSLAGVLTAFALISSNTIGSPTGSVLFDSAITILWIVGVTNSINFFDNLDGGASGTIAITAIALFLLAFQGEQFLIAALSIVLCGGTIGFLTWNKPPARIYMGDAGSLFLGLLIASLIIRLDTNPINQFAKFSIPVLLLAVPIMDTSVAVLSRILRRRSPFQGGQDHLSHRLIRQGLSKPVSVFFLWLLTLYFATIAVVISNISYKYEGLLSALAIISWITLFVWFIRQADE